MGRIELPTPSLPRKCSTAELHRLVVHLSGRRGSNPPPKAWKAFALPNELLPLDLWGRLPRVFQITEPVDGLEPPTG